LSIIPLYESISRLHRFHCILDNQKSIKGYTARTSVKGKKISNKMEIKTAYTILSTNCYIFSKNYKQTKEKLRGVRKGRKHCNITSLSFRT